MATYAPAPLQQQPVAGPVVSLLTCSRTVAVNSDLAPVGPNGAIDIAFDADGAASEPSLERWTQGVAFLPETGLAHFAVDGQSSASTAPSTPPGLTGSPFTAAQTFYPLLVEAQFTASALQHGIEQYAARALRALDAITPAWLEKELWTGALTSNPHLSAQAAIRPVGITAIALTTVEASAVRALAILEEALTPTTSYAAQGGTLGALGQPSAGGPGMIHAPRDLVALWVQAHQLEKVPVSNPLGGTGFRLVTVAHGNIVVPGAGYPGSGWAGAGAGATIPRTDTVVWAYASDPVLTFIGEGRTQIPAAGEDFGVVRGPDGTVVQSDVDKAVNTVTVRATRPALACFDTTRLVGVPVTVG